MLTVARTEDRTAKLGGEEPMSNGALCATSVRP
jgi:hypothetical protein